MASPAYPFFHCHKALEKLQVFLKSVASLKNRVPFGPFVLAVKCARVTLQTL